MERNPSPVVTRFLRGAVVVAVCAAYGGAYCWRFPEATLMGPMSLEFPTTIETVAFAPAVWMHGRMYPASLAPNKAYGPALRSAASR